MTMVRLGLDRASSVSAWLNFAGNQKMDNLEPLCGGIGTVIQLAGAQGGPGDFSGVPRGELENAARVCRVSPGRLHHADKKKGLGITPKPLFFLEPAMGFEPATY